MERNETNPRPTWQARRVTQYFQTLPPDGIIDWQVRPAIPAGNRCVTSVVKRESRQIFVTVEVTPNGGLVRESPQNPSINNLSCPPFEEVHFLKQKSQAKPPCARIRGKHQKTTLGGFKYFLFTVLLGEMIQFD